MLLLRLPLVRDVELLRLKLRDRVLLLQPEMGRQIVLWPYLRRHVLLLRLQLGWDVMVLLLRLKLRRHVLQPRIRLHRPDAQ